MGVRRWLKASRRESELSAYAAWQEHWHMIVLLVGSARDQLARLYVSGASPSVMVKPKQEIFDELRKQYRVLRPQLSGDTGYGAFFNGALNNASLLTVRIYTRWVPAFHALLAEQDGDLPKFYEAVKQLARLPQSQRDASLEKLMVKSAAANR